jgi:hypothetical protein
VEDQKEFMFEIPACRDKFKFFSGARHFHSASAFSAGEFFGSFFAHSKNERR